MIICLNIDIIARNVNGGNVVNNLFVVRSKRIVDSLSYAGSNGCGIRGEYRIIGVFGFRFGIRIRIRIRVNGIRAVGVAGQIKQIVRKSVAAGFTQSLTIRKVRQ